MKNREEIEETLKEYTHNSFKQLVIELLLDIRDSSVNKKARTDK